MNNEKMRRDMIRILGTMYKLVVKKKGGAYQEIQKLNLAFSALQRQVFGSGALSKEEEPFDKARNQLLLASMQDASEEERREYLEEAKRHMRMLR
ncbi:hypothetical protein HY491_01475 [Candidatus Woesearchaeota archaeon]|nr:hypothetical protein [Candidatus Woesearchaeota archaeon]